MTHEHAEDISVMLKCLTSVRGNFRAVIASTKSWPWGSPIRVSLSTYRGMDTWESGGLREEFSYRRVAEGKFHTHQRSGLTPVGGVRPRRAHHISCIPANFSAMIWDEDVT
jgi:hypothetical protein